MIRGSMMFPSVSSSSAALEILKLEHRLSLLAKRGAHGLQLHLARRPRSSAERSEPSWRSTVSEAPPPLSPLPCMQLSPDRTDTPTCRCHCPPHFSSHLLEDVADTSVMSARKSVANRKPSSLNAPLNLQPCDWEHFKHLSSNGRSLEFWPETNVQCNTWHGDNVASAHANDVLICRLWSKICSWTPSWAACLILWWWLVMLKCINVWDTVFLFTVSKAPYVKR